MAQELRVGGNEVLLSLAPEYRTIDTAADAAATLLGAVQRFKPFVDYLTAFKAPAECELTTVVVKNVGQIGQRISSVTLDVSLRHAKSGGTTTQPLHLASDSVPAVVLPVVEVADSDGAAGGTFAVLFPRARLALGATSVLDAPVGFFEAPTNGGDAAASASSSSAKPLQVSNGVSEADLAAAGFTTQHMTERMCKPLATEDLVTGFEGQVPVRVLAAKRSCSGADLEKMMAAAGEPAPFVLVPLEDVANRTSDINAILAASLLL